MSPDELTKTLYNDFDLSWNVAEGIAYILETLKNSEPDFAINDDDPKLVLEYNSKTNGKIQIS